MVVILVALITLLTGGGWIQIIVALIILVLFVLVFSVVTVNRSVKKFQENNPAGADSVQTFSFGEDLVNIEVTGNLQNGQVEISYDSFVEIYETKSCFYFYVSRASAYMLPKSDFTQGSPDDLRQLLQRKLTDKKFIIRS